MARFDPAATYGLLVFSILVFSTGFLGYFGARNESRFLLLLYMSIVSVVALLLIIFCALAFKAATDKAALDATWNSMSYADKRDMASKVGIDLPESETAGKAQLDQARDAVVSKAKEHLRSIGGVAVATGTILLLSIASAGHLQKKIDQSRQIPV